MKKTEKVFVATSSFNLMPNNFVKKTNTRNLKFIKNPLKKKLTSQQLIKFAKNCEYIIAGTETYNKETISKLNNLKCIFRMGSGIDNIDINLLKKKKIKILKSKITPEIAVAELIVGYILSFYRNIYQHNNDLKKKIWKKNMGFILKDKTVGIIGYGKVGRYLHKVLEKFGVNFLINDKKKINHKKTQLNTLIKKSDIISLNLNLIKNKKILNRQKLNLCKKNCLIINTSRPEVIDNSYLYELLKKNKILGACLDVFEQEPYYGKFTELENTILTPHIGSYSKEIREAMEQEALNSIQQA
jgi:D-3-phosphoglycerate dehydrogenase